MTRYDPTRHRRRSIRLKGYDYTQPGAYFITICTHERAHLFGTVVDGEMWLNEAGRVAEQCWRDIPAHFPHVELDAFVVMPNHIHGILWIVGMVDPVGAKNISPVGAVGAKYFSPLQPSSLPRGTSKTIGSIVRGFKIGVTKWFRQNTSVHTVWQRNYFEHIIRDERALNAIRRYILENPLRWHLDRYNLDRTGEDLLAREIWTLLAVEDKP
ncbi:hypothetical protein HRbin22_02627 [Candidatus Thermoflexus japonica]|uniref:Transposase IS200-like domain-containing protein n=1 Tax=Candidatus Thermoflexus japonica TaxID=2035417 RepID=A0A2H5YA64_9CHLR|nr:hypothetical protein HRbin22_02627 [Candidatus Thermoflexus japonica]